MTSESHDRLGSQAASASELDSNVEKYDDASAADDIRQDNDDDTTAKGNLELTKTTSTDAPIYITGVKLQLVFLALALVAFLMLLDISIVATVSLRSHPNPTAATIWPAKTFLIAAIARPLKINESS